MVPRAATPDDASAVAQLWLEATTEVAEYESIYTPNISHAELTERLTKELSEEVKRAYVVYAGDTLAAYVTFCAKDEAPIFVPRRYLYIIDLDVRAEFRQRGLSRLLMNEVEAYAQAQGIKRTELSVALADPRARAVWERHGFEPHLLVMHKEVE